MLAGADPKKLDGTGASSLDYAKLQGHTGIVMFLEASKMLFPTRTSYHSQKSVIPVISVALKAKVPFYKTIPSVTSALSNRKN